MAELPALQLKRYYSSLGFNTFIFFNVVIAITWWRFMYVRQDDYTQFDLTKLNEQVNQLSSSKILVFYPSNL